MSDVSASLWNLGPSTERLIERAFADSALIPANAAARLLGLDDKTLKALVDGGALSGVAVSEKTKRFGEVEIRAYLAGKTELRPCQSTSQRKAATSNTTSSTKVVGFTAARAKRLAAAQRR